MQTPETPNGTLAEQLRRYAVSEIYLPLIDDRRIFARYEPEALAAGIDFTARFPESRGLMARIVRRLTDTVVPLDEADCVTIEAHLDATALPAKVANAAIALGFGPDPFARFVPEHYSDHYTLKLKVPYQAVDRRRELTQVLQRRCELLSHAAQADAQLSEAYIELETYRAISHRRKWKKVFVSKPDALPAWTLRSIDPPRTQEEEIIGGIPLSICKQADIHIKIAAGEAQNVLIAHLIAKGFYQVTTGGGNDVMTAQFAAIRDAKRVFIDLEKFFQEYGGCSEMTMEPVRALWRLSREDRDGKAQLSKLPPLVVQVNSAP